MVDFATGQHTDIIVEGDVWTYVRAVPDEHALAYEGARGHYRLGRDHGPLGSAVEGDLRERLRPVLRTRTDAADHRDGAVVEQERTQVSYCTCGAFVGQSAVVPDDHYFAFLTQHVVHLGVESPHVDRAEVLLGHTCFLRGSIHVDHHAFDLNFLRLHQ